MGARLQGLGPSPEQRSEIATELAGHLEDLYERAQLEGLCEQEATARALAVIGDKADLRRRISLVLRGGEFMGNWKKSFWIPALFLMAAHLWIVKLIGWYMFEVALRNYHGGPLMVVSPVPPVLLNTLVPILAGMIGGLWSWLAGGGFWQRLLAGLWIWLASPVTLLIGAGIGLARGFGPHYYWLTGWSHLFWQTTLREGPYLLLGVFPFLLLKVHPPCAQAQS
jgi:hypothetical protein